MNLTWKTPVETFRLEICAENPSERHPDGRLLVEVLDGAGKMVALADLETGEDERPESERARIEPTIWQIARLKKWTAPGCAVVVG